MGAQRETLMGLAGMGDLILTCTGDLSRNRRVGLALAAGKTLEQILHDLGHVAEGVSTAREGCAGWRETWASRCRSRRPSMPSRITASAPRRRLSSC